MDYRIVCTEQRPLGTPHTEAHIFRVGTGNANGWAEQWMLDEVVTAIRNKTHRFYSYGEQSKKSAWVDAVWCAPCGRYIIKTVGDFTSDNNLDSLPPCKWA